MIAACCRDPSARSQVSPRCGVRTTSTCGAPASCSASPAWGSVRLTGVSSAQHRLCRQGGLHRPVEPGVLQPGGQPLAGKIDEPGRDGHAEQHADQVRGPLGRHVPVRRQQHRRGVDPRTVGDAARVRPRRRLCRVDLPAARAGQQRQQVLRHELDDPHVLDLRPPGARPFRAGQPGPAPRALRRRRHLHLLVRVRVPRQPRPGMPRLPAAPAVRAPLPFGGLPGLPLGRAPLARPDRVLRRRRPRGRAVRPQPPLQLRDPQLQPPVPLPLSPQLRPQHRVLGILGLDHCPQPGDQLALIPAAAGTPGSSDTNPEHAHPRPKVQAPVPRAA